MGTAESPGPEKSGSLAEVTPSDQANAGPTYQPVTGCGTERAETSLLAPVHAGGTMNRKELATAIAEDLGTDRRAADSFLGSLVGVITETVATGEPVVISGFAKFSRVERAARMGRDPRDRRSDQDCGVPEGQNRSSQSVQGRRARLKEEAIKACDSKLLGGGFGNPRP